MAFFKKSQYTSIKFYNLVAMFYKYGKYFIYRKIHLLLCTLRSAKIGKHNLIW